MLPLALQFCSGPARPQAPAPCQEQVSPEQWCCQLGPVSSRRGRGPSGLCCWQCVLRGRQSGIDECVLFTPHCVCSSHWPCVLLGNKKDCISSFRQVPTRDGQALADMLSVSGKGRRREGREVEEGGWREGGGGMWR